MSPQPRRSTLQIQILAALSHAPSGSISALARSIEASRPSVSRSLEKLEVEGLVQRNGRQLCLTDAGQQEATRAMARLKGSTQQSIIEAGRKLGAMATLYDHRPVDTLIQGTSGASASATATTTPALAEMSRAMTDQSRAALAAFTAPDTMLAQLASLVSPAEQMNRALAALFPRFDTIVPTWEAIAPGPMKQESLATAAIQELGRGIAGIDDLIAPAKSLFYPVDHIASLTKPLLEAQEAYASFLSSVSSAPATLGYGMIAEQTKLLSSAMHDALRIADAQRAALASQSLLRPEIVAISATVPTLFSSLQALFADTTKPVAAASDGRYKRRADHLLYATRPVSTYARGSRLLYEEPEPVQSDEIAAIHFLGNEALDPLLARLNPDFVGKRQGSWLALEGDNPDRLSHAAGSQKNLLLQVLRQLVPDQPLPEDDAPGSKIKARIKELMGGSDSEVEFVKHMANAVYASYTVMNKYDHTNQKDELALRAFLQAGEALLYMVLIRLPEGGE